MHRHRSELTRSGFTLVEALVAMAIMMLLMLVLSSIINFTSSLWTKSSGRIEEFQQAREGFDALTRRLSEATLNTYYDYVDSAGNPRIAGTSSDNTATFAPARYVRQSELGFISGTELIPADTAAQDFFPTHSLFFQAPLGSSTTNLPNLLNTCGFFIAYGSDKNWLPNVQNAQGQSLAEKKRFRLMQLIEPSENLSVYLYRPGSSASGRKWFTEPLTIGTGIEMVSNNVVALVLLPKLTTQDQSPPYGDASLSPYYNYDTTTTNNDPILNPKNQLPPIVQVTLVAISETSANLMRDSDVQELKDMLAGLFKKAADFAQDLQNLENYLAKKKMSYRVFSSNVPIKAAKWSREQAN